MSDETPLTPETEEKETAGAENNTQEAEIPTVMPLLAVRDIVVFNYMILPLFVGREKSVQAVDAALNSNHYILICTQKDESVENPEPGDLYEIGTVAMIMRMLKMPDGRLKVLVQGLTRANVVLTSTGYADGEFGGKVFLGIGFNKANKVYEKTYKGERNEIREQAVYDILNLAYETVSKNVSHETFLWEEKK